MHVKGVVSMGARRWQRVIAGLIAATALVGCGGAGNTAPTAAETPAASASGAAATTASATPSAPAVEVDKGLLTVDITIRRDLMDPDGQLTDEQLLQNAAERDMKAVINDNGTITYTMTRNQQRQLLDGMMTSIKESNAELIAAADNPFVAIEHNNDLSSFTMKVDRARYNEFAVFYVLGFYVQGGLYQQFSGVPADEVDVHAEIVDAATGEVLHSSRYRDWVARQGG